LPDATSCIEKSGCGIYENIGSAHAREDERVNRFKRDLKFDHPHYLQEKDMERVDDADDNVA
jgi:hypothetical protein